MPRLLIINPNTTAAVTARVADAARLALPDVAITAATGRFGAAYIASRASFAVAGHAALDGLAEHGDGVDAVLLACFGDPGLEALREVSPVPVIGLVEAACAEACEGGRRFAIVTGGERWRPMLEETLRLKGLDGQLTAIVTVAPTGAEIAADPQGALELLSATCRRCAEDGADVVILGGAGLIGLAGPVQARLGAPIICSVEAGFRAAAAALRQPPPRRAATTAPTPSTGLGDGLTRLFAQGRLDAAR